MILLLIAATLGALFTWLVRAFAIRAGLVSKPNPIIPQHRRPIAHLGGLGVFAALAASLWVLELSGGAPVPLRLLLAAGAFLAIGVLDDLVVLTPWQKLSLQVLAAGGAAAAGVRLPLTGHAVVDSVLATGYVVVVVNAFNLIDVCDGLAASVTLVLLVFLAPYDAAVAPLALAAAGACAGFLIFNSPPASIFLGDTGSHLLGALAAFAVLEGGRNASPWPFAAQAVLLVAVPLFELVFLIAVRRRKGLRFWRGSPDHFSLRLQAAGLSKLKTDLVACAVAGTCCLAALGIADMNVPFQLVVLGLVGVLFAASWRLLLRFEVPPT